MKRIFLYALPALTLLACAGKEPAPQYIKGPDQTYTVPASLPDREGMIVFYRQGGVVENVPSVFANDRIVGSLMPNHFAQTAVCGGTTLVRADSRGKRITTGRTMSLSTLAGQVNYVRVDESADSFTLVQVKPEDAEPALASMRISHVANRNIANCPAPKPVVVAAAMPATPTPGPEAVTREVTLKGDALFTFGRSGRNDMSSAGIAQLDKLINDITSRQQNLKVDRIRVVGHSDRLGKPETNKRLSLARADTVAEYFRSQGVIVPIETVGRGAEDPVTTNCKGKKRSARLVACLQADRRVTIDLIGLVVDAAP
jgi:outer membrane protein OmpA-like peptidoglycan-associated protein